MTLEEFQTAVSKIGILLDEAALSRFSTYAKLLKEWNEKMNLTAITEEEEVIEKHFFDCVLPAKGVSFDKKTVVDIGSGAGFPGIVFALLFPSCHVTLVDATKKKFAFLEEVVKQLDLHNVHFHIGRVEEMKTQREHFDIATSRGFAAMPVFLEVAAPLTKIGGTVLAMKGSHGEEELKSSGRIAAAVGVSLYDVKKESLPNGDVRINYFFKKTKKTPSRFPRTWAEIQKVQH